MGCCCSSLATAAAEAAGIEDAAFVIRGQPDPPVGSGDTAIAVLSGPTTQIGAGISIVRIDDPVNGTTIKIATPGVYQASWWTFLPTGGTVGLMCGGSIDAPAPLRVATQNPDLFFPSIWGSAVRFNWPGPPVASLDANGTFVVSQAMAANPALGILRAHLTDSAGGVVGPFGTVIADNTLRVRRIGNAA